MANVIWPINMNVTCDFDSWAPKNLTESFCKEIFVSRDNYGGCFAAYNWGTYNKYAAMFLDYCHQCQDIF